MEDNEEEVFVTESSSDDEDDIEDACDTATGSRGKREALWTNKPNNCYWPPNPANSNNWPPWTHLRPVRFGNPTYGPRMQLFSSTGWHLAIYDRRNIRGSGDELDRHTFLELSYAGVPGHVRIQSLENHLYLAMDTRGRLYGETDGTTEATVFVESLAGSYNVYLSRKFAHLGWYFGIKKSGKIKKGPKTALNQKAIKFLPRRSNIQT